uniref:lipid scramblase CLPTM1L n=1 Tax=Panthera onca TaxID=9690 RepID=UPI0029533CB5|nr:lipid scramblase CLPTM1L [Panthera onca]
MWSGRSSFTSLVVGVFVVYVVHTCWVMYGIVYTRPCGSDGNCIQPYLARRPKLQLSVYTTTRSNLGAENNVDLVLNVEDFDVESKFERTVNVSVPKKTRNNGTLYAYIFLHHAGILPWHDGKQVHLVSPLTTYMVPKPEEVNLLTGESITQQIEAEKKPPSALDEPVSHWRPRLTLNVMVDDFVFDGASLPADVHRYMKMIQLGKTVHYLPILFIDQLSNRVKDLMVSVAPLGCCRPAGACCVFLTWQSCAPGLPLTPFLSPCALCGGRLWNSSVLSAWMASLRAHWRAECRSNSSCGFFHQALVVWLKGTDGLRGAAEQTAPFRAGPTQCHRLSWSPQLFPPTPGGPGQDLGPGQFCRSAWSALRGPGAAMVRAVVWRGCWLAGPLELRGRVCRAPALSSSCQCGAARCPVPAGAQHVVLLWFGTYSESERKTEEYDTQAMKYLSYLLYPLCIGGAVYSLLNVKYKSWYSWLINSFVNGVYAFGFLFMLPQLFVNYKMKSVAHLPWKAFTYKAFNTFIDDVFAFIITMPTSHRLACFRDDVVFLVYLYQRWLYPVDKSRVNEFGESYEEKPQRKPHAH